MGSSFKIKGGENSFWTGDGKYNFTVYSEDKDGNEKDFGYVVEDVWQNNLPGLMTTNRETLIWFGPDGDSQ